MLTTYPRRILLPPGVHPELVEGRGEKVVTARERIARVMARTGLDKIFVIGNSGLQVRSKSASNVLLLDQFSGLNGANVAGRSPAPTNVPATTLTMHDGTAYLQGNALKPNVYVSSAVYGTYNVGFANGTIRCDVMTGLVSGGFDTSPGVVARLTDASNYFWIRVSEFSNLLEIAEFVAGVFNSRATVTVAITPNTAYTITVVLSGTSITASVGADSVGWTSSNNLAATKHGFRLRDAGTITIKSTLDNWQFGIGTLTAPPEPAALVTKLGVIVDLGGGGAFDTVYVNRPHFIELNSSLGKYHLYYSGNSTNSVLPGHAGLRVGLATSNDGLSWTKWGKVQSAGSDIAGDSDFFVMQDGASVVAYCSTSTTQISRRVANNADFTSFGAPTVVLTAGAGGTWDDADIRYASVVKVAATYYLFYMGNDGAIWRLGLATSSDGIVFTKHASNPILSPLVDSSWEDLHVFDPHVVVRGATFYMGYTGGTLRRSGAPGGLSFWEQIGFATSSDGVTWTRDGRNPFVVWGGASDFDYVYTIDLELISLGGQDYIIYTGQDATDKRRIGMAQLAVAL